MVDTQLSVVDVTREFRSPLVINILFILIQVSIVVIAINTAQPVVPLLNNQLLASNTLVPKIWLAIIPILSVFFSLISLVLLVFCRFLGTTILRLFAWGTSTINGILLLALLRIVLLIW